VIGGDAGLKRGKDKSRALGVYLEYGAAAIADIEIAGRIEGNAGGDAESAGVQRGGAVGGEAVNSAVMAAGGEQRSLAIKREAAGIGQRAAPGGDGVIRVNAVDANRGFLAARAAERRPDVALGIERRITDRM
jgi:hypothetical protein